jgi:hypothetical protein
MKAKVLSIAAALGLLIGSSTIGFAQNSVTEQLPGPKVPEKALMDSKAATSTGAPGHLTQETGTGGAAYAPAQGSSGPANPANPG